MKKIITLIASLAIGSAAFAQTAADAIKLSQEHWEGTARSMAMGNAFTALGGDVGGLAINPASSAVYHYSQVSITPTVGVSSSIVDYLGNSGQYRSNAIFDVSNFGMVAAFNTRRSEGLVNVNLGIAVNKKASLNSFMSGSGEELSTSMLGSIASMLEGIHSGTLENNKNYNAYVDSNAPWVGILAWNTYGLATLKNIDPIRHPDVDDDYIATTENYNPLTMEASLGGPIKQNFTRSTRGGIHEFTFNVGTNFSDRVYLGANLNFDSVNYLQEIYYSETAKDVKDFHDGFVKMTTNSVTRTTGQGINLKLGLIYRPFAGLRLGATFTTPTAYFLRDRWFQNMEVSFNNGKRYFEETPDGLYNYRVISPMRFSIGAAYTFGGFGLFSIEYENVNYSSTRLRNRGAMDDFKEENNEIINNCTRSSSVLRLGGEINLWRLSLRGGYNRYGMLFNNATGSKVSSWSTGFGIKLTERSNFDFAYQCWKKGSENFTMYDDYYGMSAPEGTATHRNNRFTVTYSIKF